MSGGGKTNVNILQFPKKTAVILIGIQASGKTTFYEKYLLGQGFAHINLDNLKTRSREARALESCLANGQSFAVDNTNPTKADRARYIGPAKAGGYHIVGCYLRSCVRESLARNEQRPRRVPAGAIANTSNRLELPGYAEGFDELWYVSIGENGGFQIEKWREEA
jgi:predicted kinase